MLYKCKICEKEFKQKCHYTNHLNRLKPCVKLTKNSSLNPQNSSNLLKINSKKTCSYCGYKSERTDNYNRHLLICKVKKQEIDEKENILNKLLEQNTLLVSKIEELNKRIDKLENEKK